MSEDIVIAVIIWVGLGLWLVFVFGIDESENSTAVMAFFWPVSIPILLVFGAIYAIYSAFAVGFQMFRR